MIPSAYLFQETQILNVLAHFTTSLDIYIINYFILNLNKEIFMFIFYDNKINYHKLKISRR